MQLSMLLICCLGYAVASPTYMKSFKIEPARTYRLSFADYAQTWNSFKAEHGKKNKETVYLYTL